MALRLDPAIVTKRAEALHHAHQVAYWVVCSYQDGQALLQGIVPQVIRDQVLRLLKCDVAEGPEEYAARVKEGLQGSVSQ